MPTKNSCPCCQADLILDKRQEILFCNFCGYEEEIDSLNMTLKEVPDVE